MRVDLINKRMCPICAESIPTKLGESGKCPKCKNPFCFHPYAKQCYRCGGTFRNIIPSDIYVKSIDESERTEAYLCFECAFNMGDKITLIRHSMYCYLLSKQGNDQFVISFACDGTGPHIEKNGEKVFNVEDEIEKQNNQADSIICDFIEKLSNDCLPFNLC